MNPIAEDILMHIGVKRRSGRYPWGSGEDPYQRTPDFLSRVEEFKKNGYSENAEDVKKVFGMTLNEYRYEKSIAKHQRIELQVSTAKSLQEDGLGPTEIGRKMGVSESTVRTWLKPQALEDLETTKKTIAHIKEQVDKKGMVDVGKGVERELGITEERMNRVLYYMETREGYPVYEGRIGENDGSNKTTQKILCVPGTPYKDIYNYDKVHSLKDYVSKDGGETFHKKFVYPKSMNGDRLMIRYKDDVDSDGITGDQKDGIVEIRRGVQDLSLGKDHYSQVRILVDDKYYIKGMAVYSDNMPDGVDVVFNTNKGRDKTKHQVLKEIDPHNKENPFGSLIKEEGGQSYYFDKDGNEQLSLINKRAAQGDWSDWKDTLPSQFLSKQSKAMAKQQLDLAKTDKLAEFEEICQLENPTIKKHLLNKFADECDSAAVHLQAAALPGQKYHVIIPVNTLKDNEIYAPQYASGTKLALVRYPHAGIFEIPVLTVNNKHAPAKKLIGEQSIDAVGINKKIADQLSGADFDGDTVMCIPTDDSSGKVKISRRPYLEDLKGFDPKMAYPATPGMKYMKGLKDPNDPSSEYDNTQKEMGMISNLIADMTLQGATDADLAKAVKHSMVVIDAGKHKLDYKKSERDNEIARLKREYQPKFDEDGNVIGGGGAYTIISKSKGDYRVPKRQGTPKVNIKGTPDYDPTRPEGTLIYKTADDAYYEKTQVNKRTGQTRTEIRTRTETSTNMAETDDAYTLVSRHKHPMELLYADYANSMKALANKARVEEYNTKDIVRTSAATDVYQNEVNSLKAKVNEALLNSPRERAAQRGAAAAVEEYKQANQGRKIKAKELGKVKAQNLSSYRSKYSTKSRKERNIVLTDREWEAIQAGAITKTLLKAIIDNADMDALRERATPKGTKTVSTAKVNKIKAMSASNYTIAEIAKATGLSPSTIAKYL